MLKIVCVPKDSPTPFVEFGSLVAGAAFVCGQELYRKIHPVFVRTDLDDGANAEALAFLLRNALRIRDGAIVQFPDIVRVQPTRVTTVFNAATVPFGELASGAYTVLDDGPILMRLDANPDAEINALSISRADGTPSLCKVDPTQLCTPCIAFYRHMRTEHATEFYDIDTFTLFTDEEAEHVFMSLPEQSSANRVYANAVDVRSGALAYFEEDAAVYRVSGALELGFPYMFTPDGVVR